VSSFHPGIDIAKAKFACATRLPNGKFRGKSLPNTPKGFAGAPSPARGEGKAAAEN
jgi:hypothetical protein